MEKVLSCDSVWKREACAQWLGVVLGSVAGIGLFLYASFRTYPEYAELSAILGFSLAFIVITLGLLGLIVAFAGVCGLVVMEVVTFLTALILLPEDDRDRFNRFRSWTT